MLEKYRFGLCAAIALAAVLVGSNRCKAQTILARGASQKPSSACSVTVTSLRCEFLDDPLGIDISRPRLSWQLSANQITERGQRQTAYEILVASSQENLDADEGDLWASGSVESHQSVSIEYDGKELTAGRECYWKVRVQDEGGNVSPWSKTARWTMGPLSSGDWKAKWIGTTQEFTASPSPSSEDCTIWDPWMRKTFHLSTETRRAEIYVASVGFHELYVNGVRISDTVLAPAVSNHRLRARYVTYDISASLRTGENVIALWLGTSWSIYPSYQTGDKPHTPIVLAQANIEGRDGSEATIGTDASWRTHRSPNRLIGSWEFRNFGGEYYDAREEVPGWNAVGFDDSNWEQAIEYEPNLIVSAEMVEPNRVIKPIQAVRMDEAADGGIRFDMGVNFVGWLEIDLTSSPGDEIEILSSERADKPITHRIRSVYVVGPSGKGTFRSRFNYQSGRWITIKGALRRPSLHEVRGYFIRTDFQRAGTFACSDDLINSIYETTLWTFENLSLGGYVVDCPQRERMGYGGDAHATTFTGLCNYSLAAFYTKWNQDWADVQFEDGYLPHTAPTYWGGGGPGWSGYCVTLPWEFYRQYGDKRILEVSFPVIERWLAYLEANSRDDMLVRWAGREGCADDRWSFLGDWLWPGAKGTNSHTRESLFFNNCYWIYNLETAALIADAIRKHDSADHFRSRADEVRRAVHAEFYSAEDRHYVGGDQTYLAVALLADVPPAELRRKVWETLEEDILVRKHGHIHAGITGGAFLFKLLMENDRHDLIHAMVCQKTYPGWGDMLRQGATTIWESWEARDEGSSDSKLHSSYLYVGAWPIHGLAGIKPDPELGGFQHFVIRPALLEDNQISWIIASYKSEYGEIEMAYRATAESRDFHLTIPPNTTAVAYIPADSIQNVSERGQAISAVKGVGVVESRNSIVVLNLQPGKYEIRAERG